jgi:3-oxoacyl-[acyl-carrier protein] reductase
MVSLTGKTALVTGASRGLGRAIALSLGEAGANVIVTDLLIEGEKTDKQKLSEYSLLAGHFADSENVKTISTAEEIKKMGVQATGLKMDVTQPDEIREIVSLVHNEIGAIDILINNAGVMDNLALMENQNTEMFERDVKVNLTGAFNCTHAVWSQMKEKQWGRIINVSSFVGLRGAFAQPGYGASKAGMIGLTRSLALEGAACGITVNAVLPGFIGTEALKLHDQKMVDRILKSIPVKRMGMPEEVASLITFLASDHSGYMTGTAIPVTGGADLFNF